MRSIVGLILALGAAGFVFQWAPLTCAAQPAQLQPGAGLAIQDGTPLRFRIKRTVSSADAEAGETVRFEVLDEIKIGDVVMIPRGGSAMGTVTEAAPKQSMGRGGTLNVVIDYARLINGDKIPLRAVKENQGGQHADAATGAVAAASIRFIPAAPFYLFVQGKDITVRKGTELTAYVNGDYPIDLAKFKRAATSGLPQTVQQPAGVLTNEDIRALRQAGLSNEVIVARIKASKGSYKIDADGITALWRAGVSDAVILAMIEAASR